MNYFITKNQIETTQHHSLYHEILDAHNEDDIDTIREIIRTRNNTCECELIECDTLEEAEGRCNEGYTFDNFSAHGMKHVNIKWDEIWVEDDEHETFEMVRCCV